MQNIDGLWWPDGDERAHKVIPEMCRKALPLATPYIARPGRMRVCVQAGGCVGVYPLALANWFEQVITFEPDSENFACLERNAGGDTRIQPHRKALGAVVGAITLHKVAGNAGASHVEGAGAGAPSVAASTVDMVTIDSLHLDAVDLIWLSTAGAELPIVTGGERTIRRHKPVVIVGETHVDKSEARKLLESWGYRVATSVPLRDYVIIP